MTNQLTNRIARVYTASVNANYTEEKDILPHIIEEIKDLGDNPEDYYFAIASDYDGCLLKAVYWPRLLGPCIKRQTVFGFGDDQARLVKLFREGIKPTSGRPQGWSANRCFDNEYERIHHSMRIRKDLDFTCYHQLHGYTKTTRAAVLEHLKQEQASIERAGNYWCGFIHGEFVIPINESELS